MKLRIDFNMQSNDMIPELLKNFIENITKQPECPDFLRDELIVINKEISDFSQMDFIVSISEDKKVSISVVEYYKEEKTSELEYFIEFNEYDPIRLFNE